MARRDMPPGPGRPKGVPNKATMAAREAIAMFVDNNAHRLQDWLDAIARGDEKNKIPPNPEKAFTLFQSVIEYHVPKLSRTENLNTDGTYEAILERLKKAEKSNE